MRRNRPSPPKRPLSKWEKERKRRRIIEIVIAITIISVVSIVSYGLYHTRIEPWRQPIVRVNDKVFDMDYFVKLLRLYGASTDDLTTSASLAEQLVPVMQNIELKRQKAEEVGIEISDQEVDDKLWELMGSTDEEVTEEELQENYQSFLDALEEMGLTESDFKSMYIEPILIETELEAWFGDQEYPEDQEYEHVQIQAMLLGTEDEALDIISRWDTEGFETLVNATEPSRSYPDDDGVEWLPRGIESDAFDTYCFDDGDIGALSDPIVDTSYYTQGGYWIVEILEKTSEEDVEEGEEYEEQWHVRAILVDSSTTAAELRERIVTDGEDFAELATEYSLHSSAEDGGDMDWLAVDTATSRFTDAVADLDVGVVSEPIFHETYSKKSGYWVIKIVDKQDQALSEDHRTQLVSEVFDTWLQEASESEDNLVEDYLNDEKIFWALAHL